MPNPIPAEIEESGRARRRLVDAARVRLATHLGALALAAALPIALLLYASEPGRQAVQIERNQASAACARIYDAGACSCAVSATIAAQRARDGGRAAAGYRPAGRRVESGRVPIAMTPDFVRRVQGCMAGARGPAD